MIITKLIGGLGNQMFQYAAGAALAKRQGAELYVDASAFAAYDRHELGLSAFGVPMLQEHPLRPSGRAWWRGWFQAARDSRGNIRVYREKAFTFDPDVLDLRGDVYLDGYWQSEKYFEDCADNIRDLFTVRAAPSARNLQLLAQVSGERSVSVHVRRGDYVSDASANAVHGTCDAGYYERALEHVERIAGRDLAIFVFSDDPDWAQEMFGADTRALVVRHNDSRANYEDLRLMAACRHHVIANSTFSWWGAWLDRRADALVVAPRQWFRDPRFDARDLVPSRWARL